MIGHEQQFPPWQGLHFVGVAGTGMSALAQYLSGMGHAVSGSDRQFSQNPKPPILLQLQAAGITCHPQDGTGIGPYTTGIVVSTAIEEGNPDLLRARQRGLPVVHRSELLENITRTRSTIAVAGTSGKSTVSAMIWHILHNTGHHPSLIAGAGLAELEARGLIGNAVAGSGNWLVMEADESDGTLVRYHPRVGVILNLDKDHKEIAELEPLFTAFAHQVQERLVVNLSHPRAAYFSRNNNWDFGLHPTPAGFAADKFEVEGASIGFQVEGNGQRQFFRLPIPGAHNMENALAAIATCVPLGISLQDCARALGSYGGIHRRHQIMGTCGGITLIDDFAHNPAKIAASIKACQAFAKGKVICWFQPHGFGPTRFLRNDLVHEINQTLRPQDQVWFSRIYYAGGSAVQDISAAHLAQDLKKLGVQAHYCEERTQAFREMLKNAENGTVLLLMGARDPDLSTFAKNCWLTLQHYKS